MYQDEINDLKNRMTQQDNLIAAMQNQIQALRDNPLPWPPGKTSAGTQNIIADDYLTDKIFDVTWKNTVHYLSFFESLDGWFPILDGAVATPVISPVALPLAAGVAIDDTLVYMTTSAVGGSQVSVDKMPFDQGLTTWNNRQYFRTACAFIDPTSTAYIVPTNSVAYLLCGSNSSTVAAAPVKYFGFKIINGVYYGVISNSGPTGEQLTPPLYTIGADSGSPVDQVPQAEARWFPDNQVQFFVNYRTNRQEPNGSLPDIITSTATSGVGRDQHLFWFSFKTTNATAKTMTISFAEYIQKRSILK